MYRASGATLPMGCFPSPEGPVSLPADIVGSPAWRETPRRATRLLSRQRSSGHTVHTYRPGHKRVFTRKKTPTSLRSAFLFICCVLNALTISRCSGFAKPADGGNAAKSRYQKNAGSGNGYSRSVNFPIAFLSSARGIRKDRIHHKLDKAG